MATIKFKEPKIYIPNPSKLVIHFLFDIIMDNPAYDKNDREILVSIDTITKNIWAYSDKELEKVLFMFLLESDKINLQNMHELTEGNIDEIIIPTQRKRMFDPNKLVDPNGYVINFEDIKPKNKIGF